MRLVLLTHPPALNSTSMPRFARMIGEGMKGLGHQVDYWTSPSIFGRIKAVPAGVRKWLGYIDQFLIYPFLLRRNVAVQPVDTLFVMADQALGMWVPRFCDRPHVIHCHDFLALRSAVGEVAENPTGWSGRQYQALIRKGFSKGRNFISVSRNTQAELHRFLGNPPEFSEVVYNGLNHSFRQLARDERKTILKRSSEEAPEEGFLMHIGGNQWYKNRPGVVEIYAAYVHRVERPLELWMVGTSPSQALAERAAAVGGKGRIRFVSHLDNEQVQAAYSHARLLIFPSLGEGFGWPIAEAMACGCRVLTTGEAPMTEVGGDAACYMARRPAAPDEAVREWAEQGASRVVEILGQSQQEEQTWVRAGLQQAALFDPQATLTVMEALYSRLLENVA